MNESGLTTRPNTPYAALYTPPDVEDAYDAWGANCGPCALAAVLGVPVSRVRRLFPDFERKPWVNPSTMWTALTLARRKAVKRGWDWPAYGLACVQWDGWWCAKDKPVKLAYRYTHWIAVAHTEYGRMVYDVNAAVEGEDVMGGWVPFAWWRDEVAPEIIASIPGAINWWLRWTCEVL